MDYLINFSALKNNNLNSIIGKLKKVIDYEENETICPANCIMFNTYLKG